MFQFLDPVTRLVAHVPIKFMVEHWRTTSAPGREIITV
jgi:hypothetical protein